MGSLLQLGENAGALKSCWRAKGKQKEANTVFLFTGVESNFEFVCKLS